MSKKDTLLIEIGTEELPPKEIKKISNFFAETISKELNQENIEHGEIKSYGSVRRIAVTLKETASVQLDATKEKIGPLVNSVYDDNKKPTQAALGFAKSCGVEFSELSTTQTPKGEKLYYKQQVKGKDIQEIIPSVIQNTIKKLPIAKRMRWADNNYSFIRPVHWFVVMLGSDVLASEEFKVCSMNKTRGHRFLSNDYFEIPSADDYEKTLFNNFVIADFEKRKSTVKKQITDKAKSLGFEPIINEELLEEVTGIVDWPHVIEASFSPKFLTVPKEALISSMQSHQKCFPLASNGKLVNTFLLVTNSKTDDYQSIRHGNEKVMAARLADAKFFFDQDKRHQLEVNIERLKNVVFQKDLGTVYEKTQRVSNISKILSQIIPCEKDLCVKTADVYKCDLVTSMVGEFPELQGIMGYYYYLENNGDAAVAQAIKESYHPRFSGDTLPESNLGTVISLAEKIDTLYGIFSIGMQPTGEKDPFGLRRITISILRILIEKKINFSINDIIETAEKAYKNRVKKETSDSLVLYFKDRLKNLLNNEYPNKILDSILDLDNIYPLIIVEKAKALVQFLKLDEASSLIEANKRVYNILQKNNLLGSNFKPINIELFNTKEEKILYETILNVKQNIKPLLEEKDYEKALCELAKTNNSIAQFFDNVMVMDKDEEIKLNRLSLLNNIRQMFTQIADIRLIN